MTRRPLRQLLPLTLLPTLLASSALGALPKPELGPRSQPSRTTEERVLARQRHWETQRAYPAGQLPEGAYAEANAAFRLIPAVHPRGPVSYLPLPAPPKPEDAIWTFLGPAPLDTTKGVYGTPNMSPTAGRASAIAVDPTDSKTIYIGYSMGGVWKSTDSGMSWAPLMDAAPSLAVGAIVIDPAQPSTIYVGTGEAALYAGYVGQGLFKSIDAGKSWNKVGGNGFDGLAISRLLLDGADLYLTTVFGNAGRGDYCTATDYEAPGQGLYKSSDGGMSFGKLRDGRMVDLEVDTSVTPRRLFVSDYNAGLLYSLDGGGQWLAPAGLPTPMDMIKARRIEVAFSASDPSIVYAGMGLGSSAAVFISSDHGASFTQIMGAPDYCETQCVYDNAVIVDPTDPGTVYLGGGICAIWKGTGVNTATPVWTNVTLPGQSCGMNNANWYLGYVHPDIHALEFDPKDHAVVYAATDGGLARSKNAGDTWERLNDGVGTVQFYSVCADPVDPKVVYGGAQDNGTMKSDGSSIIWSGITSGDGGPCAVNPTDTKNVLHSTEYGTLLRSTDAFAVKPPQFVFDAAPGCQMGYPGCGDRTGFIAPVTGDNQGGFYVGTHRLWRSTLGGTIPSWMPISGDLTLGAGAVVCVAKAFAKADDVLTAIAVAPSTTQTIYTGSAGGVIEATTDGGMTWNTVSKAPLPGRYITAIAVDSTDDKVVYASFSGFSKNTPNTPGHVFASADGGQTWTTRDTPVDLPVNSLTAHPVARDLLYAGTDLGVLITTDGGKSWNTLGDALPNVAVNAVVFQRPGTRLIAATYGRSAFAMTFTPGALTPVPASLAFSVEQGKPDPAPQTVIVTNSDIYGSIIDVPTIAGDVPWLSVTPGSGVASGAIGVTLTASAAAAGSPAGEYDGNIVITPLVGAAVDVRVHLSITKPPPMVDPKMEDTGCGCWIGGGSPALPPALSLGLAGLLLARRRRRACVTPSPR